MSNETHGCDDHELTVPTTPVRNRYFFGKQMGVAQFQRDQTYHRHQAWLLNRLISGSGIVCGLHVSAVEHVLTVSPGVAIDGLGRVVIVPTPATMTVPRGTGRYQAKVWLCYCERLILPAPTCGDPCHPNASMEYDALEESFRLDIRPIEAPQPGTSRPSPGLEGTAPSATPGRPTPAKPPHPPRPEPSERGDCEAPSELCIELATIEVQPKAVEVVERPPPRGSASEGALAERVRVLERRITALEATLGGDA